MACYFVVERSHTLVHTGAFWTLTSLTVVYCLWAIYGSSGTIVQYAFLFVLFITVFYPFFSEARRQQRRARRHRPSAPAPGIPEFDKENRRVLQVPGLSGHCHRQRLRVAAHRRHPDPCAGGRAAQQCQRVLCGLNLDDARAGTYVAASAVLISIDGSEEVDGEFQRLTAFLREQSARRANLPVFLYGERRTIEKVPSKLLKYIHGFIFLFEDTKSFISRRVMRAAEDYMKNLLPRSSRR